MTWLVVATAAAAGVLSLADAVRLSGRRWLRIQRVINGLLCCWVAWVYLHDGLHALSFDPEPALQITVIVLCTVIASEVIARWNRH